MSRISLPIAGGHEPAESLIAGIDLGTTNSLVAVMRGGRADVLPGEDGSLLVPSVVHFPPVGPPIVGAAAAARLVDTPERTVYSVKRLMGRAPSDVEAERALLPYALSDRDPGLVRILIDDRALTPSEVSACILRELKRRAESHLGQPVTQAVITVPAYFNDAQRQATRDAGRLAGLEVLRIVNEPTAACLAYGLDRRREATVAVYDLGGGTFDISILKLKDGIFEVLATNGDTHLGGDDFDRALATRLLEAAGATSAPAPVREALRLEAERVKRELSAVEEAASRLPDGAPGPVVTRAEFEALVAPIVERTLGPCRSALEDAGLRPEDVDEVVLVGGSTRIPLVRRRVQEVFGRPPHCELDPDLVVALGAGVQAGILAGEVDGLLLLDVNALSLGLETYGGTVEKLIPRNSTIPYAARQMFTTGVEGQTAIEVHVVQGERELASENRSLARFQVHVPPMPAGWPKLEVTFLVDENGILAVTAYEHRSQAEARIEVRPSYGLTEDEVERMVIESFEHAEEDLRFRRETEARVEAAQVILHTEKQLPLAEAYVDAGRLTPRERDVILESLSRLRSVAGAGDPEVVHAALEDLELATRKLAQLVMDQAVGELLRGRSLDDSMGAPASAPAAASPRAPALVAPETH